MWGIKQVKKEGRRILKNNIWTLLFVSFFMMMVVGNYIINKDAFSNLKIVYSYIVNKGQEANIIKKDESVIDINPYIDEILSQTVAGNMTGIINKYNEEHNISKGLIYTIFNVFTKGQLQIQNIFNYIESYGNRKVTETIILTITASIGMLIRILLTYPIRISESRTYLESINYKKTKINRMIFAFKKNRYISSVKTVFLMEIKKFLWNLTIIGGFIKNYSYKMVTYIVAENPTIKPNDAIKMSKEMMNGNKLQAFKLDISFLGWNILQYITFGLAGIYVSSYYTASCAGLYKELREEYIKNKKFNYEQLNDYTLFEKNELEKYPDEYEIHIKKIKIDYDKKYEATSIILFFFLFSFVGWIWEIALCLFVDGTFANRGVMYGPWLPIYGTGCTLVILLTKFKSFRKLMKNPFATFGVISILCTIIEYITSWYIEKNTGLRYWDYTGIFLNINGRVALESSIFFGLGGGLCVYIVAPYLERKIQKVARQVTISFCILLVFFFVVDEIYSLQNPREGVGITTTVAIMPLGTGFFGNNEY